MGNYILENTKFPFESVLISSDNCCTKQIFKTKGLGL